MKRISAIIILILLFFSGIFAFCNNNHKYIALDSGAVQRDYRFDTIHYLDDEAIALADELSDVSLRSEALKAYNLVNEEREAAGLGTLVWDSNLESTSDVRARECSQSFSHTRPNNQPWYTVNSDIMGGENLAFGYDNAQEVVEGWMNSPTHRENILYPTFTKVSISIFEKDGTLYWAQEFGY